MEKWQAIILDIASAWPDTGSWNKDSQWCGRTFYPERLKDMGVGMFVASMYSIIAWVIDSFLPWWFGVMVLVWLAWLRSRTVRLVLDKHRASSSWYLWNWILWSTLLLCNYIIISPRWRISFDVGIGHFVFGWVLAWFQHVHSDGPPGWLRLRATSQWDAAVGYSMLHWLIYDGPRHTLWTTLVAAVCICIIVLHSLRHHLPEPYRGKLGATKWWRYASTLLGELDELRNSYGQIEAMVTQYPLVLQVERCYREQNGRSRAETSYFQYSSLRDGEIRLLKLLKADQLVPGTIKAQLVHDTLSADPEYEALSYRWGDAIRTHQILVDGKPFAITRSAFELLLARRSYLHDRTVWLDAICINQDDAFEKSRQVQLMHRIYQTATRVIMLPRFGEDVRLAAGAVYELGLSGIPADDGDLRHMRGIRSPAVPPYRPIAPRWKTLVELLAQEYFSRAWVVQEVVAGREVQIFIGSLYISWDTFATAASRLLEPETLAMVMVLRSVEYPLENPSETIRIGNILHMHNMRADAKRKNAAEWRIQVEVRGLISNLFMMREFHASDPRDKIYGILGLVRQNYSARDNNGFRVLLPLVDYSKSTEDVLLDTSSKLLLHHRPCPIDLLALAGSGWPELTTLGPSWTIKFPEKKTFMRFTIRPTRKPRFHAGGRLSAEARPTRNMKGIEIKGAVCDAILAIDDSRLVDLATSSQTNSQLLKEFMLNAKTFAQTHVHILSSNADLQAMFLIGRSEQHATVDLSEWQAEMDTQLANTDQARASREQNPGRAERESDQSGFAVRRTLVQSCAGRRFAITQNGRLCLVPPLSVAGDHVWVPCGAQAPYIIRTRVMAGQGRSYQLIGESYVQGIMNGEAMDESNASYITLI